MALGVALAHRRDADRDHGHELLARSATCPAPEEDVLLDAINQYTWRVRALRVVRPRCRHPAYAHRRRPSVPGDSGWHWAFLRRVCWWRHCSIAVPTDCDEAEAAITSLADAPTDDGLVIREVWLLRLRALLARAPVTRPPTATIGIATAPWRQRLASRGISRGLRRCRDPGCPFGGGDLSVHRR